MTQRDRWPRLVVDEWTDTRDTLHLYTQVAGKIRLANEPIWHHWWNTPLYLTASGLTTALMPHATGPSFQIDFDFLRHAVVATTVDGTSRCLNLTEAPPVAEFHARLLAALDDLGVGTDIWPMPVEIPGASGSTRTTNTPATTHTPFGGSGGPWSLWSPCSSGSAATSSANPVPCTLLASSRPRQHPVLRP